VKPKTIPKISRRNFLKSSAMAAAGAAGAGALTQTPPHKFISEANAAVTKIDGPSSSRVPGYCSEDDWLGAAPVISDADISKTIDIDVLVLGGGHAGLLAALGASDKGAKVAVIEKQAEKTLNEQGRLGEDIGHVNSKWLINRGYGPYDTGEIVAEFVRRAAGRCNPNIIRLFVENSGAMFDRLVEVYEEYKELRKANDSRVEIKVNAMSGAFPGGAPGGAGNGNMPEGSGGTTKIYDFSNIMSKEFLINQVQRGVNPKDYPIKLGGYKTWPCNAQFQGPVLHKASSGSATVLRWFQKYHVLKTTDQGADWYYGTTSLVLTQDASGAVTGAIAQDADKKYMKFRASKGVIVATGDFIGNPDMCWALLNECQEWAERSGTTKGQFARPGLRNGQGHKMICWAGGMIEPSPRGYMGIGGGAAGPWGEGPMLQLNANARRFCNEASTPLIGPAAIRQPSGILCVVTDKKFMKSVEAAGLEHGGPNYGRPVFYDELEEDMGKVLGTGAKGAVVRGCAVAERMSSTVYGANTLEELAGYLGYTGDLVKTFVETIGHYNKLCHAGIDSDYGKDAKAMIAIDEPPFYGCKNRPMAGARPFMVTLSGVVTDDKLRPLNKQGQSIKGLFACGNTLGGRYGLGYSTPFAGNSIGMAMTHGWLAGKFAAET
jgi:hypothetical protein